MKNEQRCVPAAEMRVVKGEGDKPSKITGYAAVFGAPSDPLPLPGSRGKTFVETIRAGAFTNALKNGADVRALVNHDPNLIIGRSSAGTLRLSEDEKGLRYEVDLADTAAARDAATSIDRKDMSGCSFGFRTIKDQWGVKDGVTSRELIELELIDVGPVTFPAYGATEVDVRSMPQEVRAIVEVDDRSLQYVTRYAIDYLRRCQDACRSVMEICEAIVDGTLTDADVEAMTDCDREADALVEKINRMTAMLDALTGDTTGDDSPRSAVPALERAQRLLKLASAAD